MFKVKMLNTFKQVEPQHLSGLTAGAIISQRPVAYNTETKVYGVATCVVANTAYIENGIICSLDDTAHIVNYVANTPAYIHYDEELNCDYDAKNMFAVEGEGAETYIRLIRLFPGDEFVTDQVTGTAKKYATVTNGKIAFSDDIKAATDMFYCEGGNALNDTLPNGDTGYHFIYLG